MDFTEEQLIAKVRELAAARPRVRYKPYFNRDPDNPGAVACLYGSGGCSDGTVGCIFGQAFVELGIAHREALDDGRFIGEIAEVLENIDLSDSNGLDDWCMVVQKAQDDGKSWGEAIKIADAQCPITV